MSLTDETAPPAPTLTTEFIAFSELDAPGSSGPALEDAFRSRLGAVDAWPGFRRLEVWADARQPGRYAMVSWWASHDDFLTWFRSDDHRASHGRVPTGEDRPRAVTFRRFSVVAR